jgi:PAS domain S-box-containing protein
MIRPIPTDVEIKLNPKKYIVSKTDRKGKIIYVNDYFTEISKYSEVELVGSPHNIIRHPDMPKIIFKIMWNSIENNRNITAVVKNLAKNGKHYWIITDFDIQKDANNEIKNYVAYRWAAAPRVVKAIEPLYKKLVEIEKEQNDKASEDYLANFLDEKNMSYQQFIENLAKPKKATERLLNSVKKLFS